MRVPFNCQMYSNHYDQYEYLLVFYYVGKVTSMHVGAKVRCLPLRRAPSLVQTKAGAKVALGGIKATQWTCHAMAGSYVY